VAAGAAASVAVACAAACVGVAGAAATVAVAGAATGACEAATAAPAVGVAAGGGRVGEASRPALVGDTPGTGEDSTVMGLFGKSNFISAVAMSEASFEHSGHFNLSIVVRTPVM